MRVFALFIVLWQSVFKVSNVAVTALFRFFSVFLFQLAFISNLEVLQSFSGHFPNTLLKVQKLAKLNRNDFKQLVCCPKCCALYIMDECIDGIGTHVVPQVCSSKNFPRHPAYL